MIYIPKHFNEPDREALHALIQRAPFATFMSALEGDVQVSHLPLLLDTSQGEHGVLSGHMARANPHWHALQHGSHLAIFHGAHRYISPQWYDVHPSVPTWNYAVVHARGHCHIFEDHDALVRLTQAMTERFERENGTQWTMPEDEDYLKKMTAHIVGFELVIDQLQGKFKLSQNRLPQDRQNVISALESIDTPWDQDLIDLMRTRAS